MFILPHLIFSGFNFCNRLLHLGQADLDILAHGQIFSCRPNLPVDLGQLLIHTSFLRLKAVPGGGTPIQYSYCLQIPGVLRLHPGQPVLIELFCLGQGVHIGQGVVQLLPFLFRTLRIVRCLVRLASASSVRVWNAAMSPWVAISFSRRKSNCSRYRSDFITS